MGPQKRTRLYWCLVHDQHGTIASAVLAEDDQHAANKCRALCLGSGFSDDFEVREGKRLVHAETTPDQGRPHNRVA